MSRTSDSSADSYGITDEDVEQIEAYLGKRRYERSIDDLRPPSDE